MFSLPYVYFYLASSLSCYAIKDTIANTTPANELVHPIMGLVKLITRLANFVLLILCIIYAEQWWYALAMMGTAFGASFLLPPFNFLGYIGIISAPVCSVLAYINLFA